ncbi:MAG TPA: alpha-amylase family glycosyl hydrolase [Gemmatimonadales bacterium]|nr:alpha-amylase family glycosyl hydrolase [Gemmatimonadales bacterium]
MLPILLALLQAQPQQRPNVCYEVFVRSFYDGNGDGIGDFPGLTKKLDYIAGLGVDCVWLMPVAESPSYHGYDVTNYNKIEPDYGTNGDFKAFVGAAHRRRIKVIVDLVLNHVSSQHPWFQEALRDTTSAHRNWFLWSRTPGNNWHKSPVRDEYYYGLFWSGMPDLNYNNPAVLAEMKNVAQFWLKDMGVDGFRLDAVRHLIEEGNEVSNTPGTHAVLRDFTAYVRNIAPRAYTIGEVWDSIGAILSYYPDQLEAYFAFPISEALVEAVRSGKAGQLLPNVMRFQDAQPAWRWAPFQRNHDQTRTMTALRNDSAAAQLSATILLTLPGIPFVYYGEEIGMTGDKPDERLRTPMQWELAPAAGFTKGKAWEALQPDSFTANVAVEDRDTTSLLNRYRRLIHLREATRALRYGTLVPLESGNEAVLAYVRKDSSSMALVLANLGSTAVEAVALSSTEKAADPGRYALRNLLGGPSGQTLIVENDGRIRGYLPLPVLSPRKAYVFELVR